MRHEGKEGQPPGEQVSNLHVRHEPKHPATWVDVGHESMPMSECPLPPRSRYISGTPKSSSFEEKLEREQPAATPVMTAHRRHCTTPSPRTPAADTAGLDLIGDVVAV